MSTQQQFIDSIMPSAVKIQLKHGLPAAAIVAQACLETGYGKYVLKEGNKYSYNLFNIKGSGTNGSVSKVAWEVYNNQRVDVRSNFRAYHSYAESFEDYVGLITGYSRYRKALEVKSDSDQYLREVHAAGYATDPQYSNKLIYIMDQYGLREKAAELIKRMVGAVFVDVLDHWAKGDIEWLAKEGLVKGDEQGRYNPDKPATRAEVAVLLKRTIDYVTAKVGAK